MQSCPSQFTTGALRFLLLLPCWLLASLPLLSHNGGMHGSTQADQLLEKLRVLHPDPQAAGREKPWAWFGPISSNKAMTPNPF
ncbi:mCG147899 [Mus musculus]|nr:mCG147899 [Mus musculus]